MAAIRLGRRGQITIPGEIRRLIGLQEGQTLAIICDGEQLILRPISQTLLDLKGSVHVEGPQDFNAIRRQVAAQRAAKGGMDGK
jgi:AbrB family looped-hinge helix DNA binding protein